MNNSLIDELKQNNSFIEIVSAEVLVGSAELVIVKFYTPDTLRNLILQVKNSIKTVTLVGELKLIPIEILSEYFENIKVSGDYLSLIHI